MKLLRYRRLAAGAIGGLAGCAILAFLPSGVECNPVVLAVFCTAYGMLFAALLGTRPLGPGAGLMWALGYAFFTWIAFCAVESARLRFAGDAVTVVEVVRGHFAALAGIVLGSVPVGLAVGSAGGGAPDNRRPFNLARAVCAGGFAGIFGGWAFGKWMEQAGFFPLIAGLVRSDSVRVGVAVHFTIAVFIGATFGLLFQREIRSLGSSLAWGASYGILWWFAGALTLSALLRGMRPDWSAEHAAGAFGSLVGHIVYGVIVGLLYAAVDNVWAWLFERSDPLNREVEGPGALLLASLGRGAAASLVGGLLFSGVMLATGALSRVAQLVGGTSILLGFAVHLAIAALIGATYGLFFHYEALDEAATVAWGTLYGLTWWFLGPLTLFPILLGHTFTWTLAAANAEIPSLIGHLLYGIGLAVTFRALERRHLEELFVDDRLERRWKRLHRPAGTPAPAVCFFFIGMGVVLPIALGQA
jgi:hypothetical protein